MGCVSSSSAAAPKNGPKTLKGKKKSSKALDSIEKTEEISEQELHRMKEQMLQRHDTEIDILTQLSAERAALRQMASGKIERKLSCEELLDSMTEDEVCVLRESSHAQSLSLQRTFQHRLDKRLLSHDAKPWMLYNNIDALNDVETSIVGVFLINFLFALRQKKKLLLQNLSDDERERHIEREKEREKSLSALAHGDISQYIRALPVATWSLDEHYAYNYELHENPSVAGIYEYELPPGLVTLAEVQHLIEAVRNGGKVAEKSVQKLIRLGYAHFRVMGNVSRVTVKEDERLIVVGDIHGQLADLLHVLSDAGLPSRQTTFIFNGDFVDRGEFGCECMCVLLALLAAFPKNVFLNRGNHEDYAICSVYGFQAECYEKYDPLTFAMFVELFQHIPLFCVVNDAVLVVHGGLFHHADATLDELREIDRSAFSLEDIDGGGLEEGSPVPRANRERFLKQLARDALWSDPSDAPGAQPSQRGAGIAFGPDVTRAFLAANGLAYVIRSHECVRAGYEEAQEGVLCTLFSASDYGGSGNSAAYMEMHALSAEEEEERTHGVRGKSFSLSPSSASARLSAKREKERERARTASHAAAPHTTLSHNDESRESELKFISTTNLAYKVHYYFAEPLRAKIENNALCTTRETLVAPTLGPTNAFLVEKESEEEDAFFSLSLSRSLSLQGGLQDTRVSPGRPRARNVTLGGLVPLEELLWSRKALLLDTLEQKARLWRESLRGRGDQISGQNGEGCYDQISGKYGGEEVSDEDALLPLRECVRVLQEIAKASIPWKKLFLLLLTDEDRVSLSVGEKEKEKEPDRAARESPTESERERQRERQRERAAAREQQDREGDVYVRFRVFFARYEDEVRAFVRRKEEEANRATMAQLSRYLDSLERERDRERECAVSVDDVGLSHVNGNEHDEVAKTRFHGHAVRPEVVFALYMNALQLENAFLELDANGDGFFTKDDLDRVCRDFSLVDEASGELTHMPAHVHSSYYNMEQSPDSRDIDAPDGSSRVNGNGLVVDATVVFSLLDTRQCGEVDINAFFEAARLSLATHEAQLTTYTAREREWSLHAELRRLTATSSTAALHAMLGAVAAHATHTHSHTTHTHTPQKSALAVVELRRGVEIAVDSSERETDREREKDAAQRETVGLDI